MLLTTPLLHVNGQGIGKSGDSRGVTQPTANKHVHPSPKDLCPLAPTHMLSLAKAGSVDHEEGHCGRL